MMRVLSRLITPVTRPTPKSLVGFALASVIANAVIISTGAAVRLSSSGLGCPDWPQCTKTSVVAAHSVGQTSLNTAIEFTNRLLNFPLVAIAGLTWLACLIWYRQHGGRASGRRDIVWLSAILPLGVIAQAVVGGIVVLTKLNPAMVSLHFLLSTAIILSAAVVLHARVSRLAAEQEAGPGAVTATSSPVSTRRSVLTSDRTGPSPSPRRTYNTTAAARIDDDSR